MDTDGAAPDGDHSAVKQIVQRAASDWLSLRRPADATAREAARPAIARLDAHVKSQLAPEQAARVIDIGAGTGANLAWLAPRLTVRQRWTLIDRDEDLLNEVPQHRSSDRVVDVQRLALDLSELDDVLVDDGPTLVTCTAVLDVLTETQVRSLAALLARRRAAVLFSLSVSGEVDFQPALDLDGSIGEAFNSHQRRSGLAGPRATALAAQVLSASGFDVEVIDTPWVLGPGSEALIERYLTDRVASAVAQDPSLQPAAGEWLETRRAQLRDGNLAFRVGHQDLMALPFFT